MASLLTPFDEELFKNGRNEDLVVFPSKGKYYYYTAWPTMDEVSNLSKNTFLVNNKFAYAGKFIREASVLGLRFLVFLQNYKNRVKEVLIEKKKTALYELNAEQESVRLPVAKKLEVVCNAQEGRHYYVTNFTEFVHEGDRICYYTIHEPTEYVGKHIGSCIEGWGKDMKEWSYFMKEGKEVVIEHTDTIAFYHVALPPYATASATATATASASASTDLPPSYQVACAPPTYDASMCEMPINSCKACKQLGHRIHTCPNEQERECFYDQSKPKEYFVVRTPIVGKYYEATFWDRREDHFKISYQRHFTKETTPRKYVGKYLRHIQEGYGDSADHWALFLIDGIEIRIEYDYEGKRAFYEVPERT